MSEGYPADKIESNIEANEMLVTPEAIEFISKVDRNLDESGSVFFMTLTSHTYNIFKSNGIEISAEDSYAINRDGQPEVMIKYIALLREKVHKANESKTNNEEPVFSITEEDLVAHRMKELLKVLREFEEVLEYGEDPFHFDSSESPSQTEWDRVVGSFIVSLPDFEKLKKGEISYGKLCQLHSEEIYKLIREKQIEIEKTMPLVSESEPEKTEKSPKSFREKIAHTWNKFIS